MKTKLSILLLLLTQTLLAQSERTDITLSHVTSEGKSTIHRITKEEAKNIAEWDPESGKPIPLLIDAAIKKGKEWLISQNPKMDKFQINSVQLNPIRDSRFPNRWYYELDFNPIVGDHELYGGNNFRVIVLMNNKVVEPITRDSEY